MKNNIIIIDDESIQAIELSKSLTKIFSDSEIIPLHEENLISEYVENYYFNIAIVDLRMDKFQFNGFDIIQEIKIKNPFAKIIIISAYVEEYVYEINKLLKNKSVYSIISKEKPSLFIPAISECIRSIETEFLSSENAQADMLTDLYSRAKNEKSTYVKGTTFEYFVSLLFTKIGFHKILYRVIDKSRGEVDLIIRNEINDLFLEKFTPYIFLECKNLKDSKVGKNEFIVFHSKISHSNGLSNLGFLVTSGYIAKTTYLEAIRESSGNIKIIFISNPEIYRLINSNNMLEEFKDIIDEQVKDN
jgi:DNA-binding NarL/FixJ family response regulator